jgi:hypothetical protein
MRTVLMTAALAALSALGCLRTTQFTCANSTDCGASGTCQPTGFCSFADTGCTDGQRYAPSAGSYAGTCVGGGSNVVDAPMGGGDGQRQLDAKVFMDATGSSCPSGFTMPSGQAHQYMLISGGTWTAEKTACSGMGGNVYLAIPDDAGELTAIDTIAGGAGTYWVGLSDGSQTNTYKTVMNATATFLPWATSQPTTNNPGHQNDCVEADASAATFSNADCASSMAAVCECD